MLRASENRDRARAVEVHRLLVLVGGNLQLHAGITVLTIVESRVHRLPGRVKVLGLYLHSVHDAVCAVQGVVQSNLVHLVTMQDVSQGVGILCGKACSSLSVVLGPLLVVHTLGCLLRSKTVNCILVNLAHKQKEITLNIGLSARPCLWHTSGVEPRPWLPPVFKLLYIMCSNGSTYAETRICSQIRCKGKQKISL